MWAAPQAGAQCHRNVFRDADLYWGRQENVLAATSRLGWSARTTGSRGGGATPPGRFLTLGWLARAPRTERELSRTEAGRALVRHGSRPAWIPSGPLLSTVLQENPRRDLDVLPSLPVSPTEEGGISDGAVSSSWPARTARQAHSSCPEQTTAGTPVAAAAR